MGRPTFLILRLLSSPKDNDDYITKEEIEANPSNLELDLKYQSIEIHKIKSIYIYDEKLVEKQISELQKLNKFVIDKRENNFKNQIEFIESNFSFKVIKKSKSYGNIEMIGESPILSFYTNLEIEEKYKSNFEILNYSYKTEDKGFYDETISYQYDIMIDDFYGEQFSNYIGLKRKFIEIAKYVKPEFREYFTNNFLNEFNEGKTIFHWDY